MSRIMKALIINDEEKAEELTKLALKADRADSKTLKEQSSKKGKRKVNKKRERLVL